MTWLKQVLLAFYNWFELLVISPITFNYFRSLYRSGKYWDLTEEDWKYLRVELKAHYYILLSYRKTHLTSYLQQITSLILNRKLTQWTHAFLNADDGTATDDIQYIFEESTARGVHYSTFREVLDCDSVALIVPKGMTPAEWTAVVDAAIQQLGKPYDALFDCSQDQKLSCVELVRRALMSLPDYATRFANFEAMIKEKGYVLPQMLAECPDFEIVWKVRR